MSAACMGSGSSIFCKKTHFLLDLLSLSSLILRAQMVKLGCFIPFMVEASYGGLGYLILLLE